MCMIEVAVIEGINDSIRAFDGETFQRRLKGLQIYARVRETRGDDESAACGPERGRSWNQHFVGMM